MTHDDEINKLMILEESGRLETSAGEWYKAENIWDQIRKDFPSNETAYVLGGYVALNSKNYEKAHDLLSHASEKFPNNIYGHMFLSEYFYSQGDFIKSTDKILKCTPSEDVNLYKHVMKLIVTTILNSNVEKIDVRNLIEFMLKQKSGSNHSFLPELLTETNNLRDINHYVYNEICNVIQSNFETLVTIAEVYDNLCMTCLSLNIMTEYFDVKMLVRSCIMASSREKIHELFHRGAHALLHTTNSVLNDIIKNKEFVDFDDERLLILLQLSNIVNILHYKNILKYIYNYKNTMLFEHISANAAFRRMQYLNVNVNKTVGERPLRIALCVSGQLRGYKKAFSTWEQFCFEGHEVTKFIHVWRNVGRKFPVPQHAERSFGGHFLKAYRNAFSTIGLEGMLERYPNLFKMFNDGSHCTSDEISNIYQTPNVIVEDDSNNSFDNFNNFQKMYYKIKYSHMMTDLSGQKFDLIIRIRPDKPLLKSTIDYHKIYYKSINNCIVFCDDAPYFHPKLGYIVGDQFAIGQADLMRVYASAYDQTIFSKNNSRSNFPKQFLPHVNLAYTLLYNGISVSNEHGFIFDTLLDPEQLSLDSLCSTILQDISSRNKDDLDNEIIMSLQNDSIDANS